MTTYSLHCKIESSLCVITELKHLLSNKDILPSTLAYYGPDSAPEDDKLSKVSEK